eukprot:785062_1
MADRLPNIGSEDEALKSLNTDKSSNIISENDKALINSGNRDKIQAAAFHMLAVALATGILIPLATQTDLSTENIVGFAFLLNWVLYLVHIWYLFLRAPYLYRICTISHQPPDWAPMSITKYNKTIHPGDDSEQYHPIESISEFSAISGGVAKTLLARIGTMQWGILMTLIVVQIIDDSITIRPSIIIEIVGAYGIDMIGTFYDDPNSRGMQIGHYSGVLLATGCLIGFWIQRFVDVKDEDEKYLWLPIVLTVIFIIFFGLFAGYEYIQPLPKTPTMKQITSRSRLIIGFETIGLGMLMASFILYFTLQNNET